MAGRRPAPTPTRPRRRAAGGDPRQALPVAAAWRSLHIAAKLLDDVEDGDVARISAAPTDPPRVINLATGFITMEV